MIMKYSGRADTSISQGSWDFRTLCLRRYNVSPSMFKLIQLLKSTDDVKIGKRISMFIQKCKIA